MFRPSAPDQVLVWTFETFTRSSLALNMNRKYDARKCRTQVASPYFDFLSERFQPLSEVRHLRSLLQFDYMPFSSVLHISFFDYIDLIDLVVSFVFGTNDTIFVVQTLGGGKKSLKELPYYPAGAVEIPNVIPERMITICYNVDFPLGKLSLMSIGLLCF